MSLIVKRENNVSKLDLASLLSFFLIHFIGFMFKYPQLCSRKPQASQTTSNSIHKTGGSIEGTVLYENGLVMPEAAPAEGPKPVGMYSCAICKKVIREHFSLYAVSKRWPCSSTLSENDLNYPEVSGSCS